MAYIQTRQVTVGELMNGTFAQVFAIRRELGIYFAAFFAAGLLVDFIEPLRGPIGLAATVGYFAGQYWLYREALRRSGVVVDPRFKGFSLFFMAMILIWPIMIGMNFLVIPGLLLAAKWVMAPAFLVSEERDLFQAIGDSWRASSGNTLALTGAFTILCLIWFAVVGVSGAIAGGLSSALGGVNLGSAGEANAFQWLAIHLLPVLLLGLSVTAYRALADTDDSLVAVFE